MGCLKIIVFVICLTVPANAGNLEIRKLKTKVNFFLDNMMDVTHTLQEIRDDVTSLQERLNATVSCDLDQCLVSSEKDPDTENQPDVTTTTISGDIETRMTVIQEAFQDEKFALRTKGQQQDESIAAIAKTVDNAKKDLANDVALIKSEISNAIADMNSKFNITLSSVAEECIAVSNRVHSVEHRLLKDMQQREEGLKGQIKALSDMIELFRLARYGTSVYKVHNENMSWTDAKAKCQKEGFYLAEINDAGEDYFVRKLGEKTHYWVGGSDKGREGVWKWATSGKDVDMALFRTGEPNNAGGKEHCMHYYDSESNGYNDNRCDWKIQFVCEQKLNWPFFEHSF